MKEGRTVQSSETLGYVLSPKPCSRKNLVDRVCGDLKQLQNGDAQNLASFQDSEYPDPHCGRRGAGEGIEGSFTQVFHEYGGIM